MKITAGLIQSAHQFINPINERQLDLKGTFLLQQRYNNHTRVQDSSHWESKRNHGFLLIYNSLTYYYFTRIFLIA